MQLPDFDLENGAQLKDDSTPLLVQERVYSPVKARPMRYGLLWFRVSKAFSAVLI